MERVLTVGGRRLRVAVRPGTDPGRPPLLLCNGIGTDLSTFQRFVDALDPSIEVIRFDPPGVGGSPLPPLPYPFPLLARLVGRMLTELGYRRFDVLGVSWGGGLAQQLALQNPRRCRRVVLVATATGTLMVPAAPRVLLHMATARRHHDVGYARSIAGEIYGGRLRRHPELAAELAGETSGRGYLYQLASGLGWTSLPFLPLVGQPTLILAGADDPIIPLVNAKVMTRLIRHAQLHVYPDGHLGLLTMTDELAAVITAFLAVPR
jgi:poly(3-hydroxyalkanoate) depolymerase